MNYNISSDEFDNLLIKELLEKLSRYFEKEKLPFYVIGATARDIIMQRLLQQRSARHTQDLDIAIAIADWQKFEEISNGIAQMDGFEKSLSQKQRFYYKKVYEIDIIPFGEVAKEDKCIYWPPEEEFKMSVQGFDEALKDFMIVRVDGEFDIRVVSLPGLFLLKLNAWIERNMETSKDGEDLWYIIENYFDACQEHYTEINYHQEVYDMDDFDLSVAGALWLGYDIVSILTPVQLEYYHNILEHELSLEEESRLIEHMMKQNIAVSYEKVYRVISQILSILCGAI